MPFQKGRAANPTGKGGFKKGNKASPGRASRKTEERLLAVMSDAITDADWKEITARAVHAAKGFPQKQKVKDKDDGVEREVTTYQTPDAAARTWLSKYMLGEEPAALKALEEKLTAIEAKLSVPEEVAKSAGEGPGGGEKDHLPGVVPFGPPGPPP